jgi:chromosome segregation ATPase
MIETELKELKEELKAKRIAVANRTEIAKKRSRELSKVQTLEVMIENERRQLNARRTENSRLRSEIDILRKNRSSYNQANKRMTGETLRLTQKAREFSAEGGKLEKSVDYARREIERLNLSVSLETSQYSSKLSQLESKILDDKKTKSRFMNDLSVGETVHEVSEAGQIVFRILDHWKQKLKAKHKELDTQVKFANQLYESFEVMKASAKTTSIDELMKALVVSYEQNRKLLHCVLSLTRAIEEVEADLTSANSQIEMMQKSGRLTKEGHSKVIGGLKEELTALRESQREALEKVESIKSQFIELREPLEALTTTISKVGIQSIYEIRFPDPDIELDIATARSLLNAIEDKLTTIIMLKTEGGRRELSMLDLEFIPEKKGKTQGITVAVEKTLVTDIEEESAPLTAEQIHAKASRRVLKMTSRTS